MVPIVLQVQITVFHISSIIDAYQTTNRDRGIAIHIKLDIGKRVVDFWLPNGFTLTATNGMAYQTANGIIQICMEDRHSHGRMDFAIQHVTQQTT